MGKLPPPCCDKATPLSAWIAAMTNIQQQTFKKEDPQNLEHPKKALNTLETLIKFSKRPWKHL